MQENRIASFTTPERDEAAPAASGNLVAPARRVPYHAARPGAPRLLFAAVAASLLPLAALAADATPPPAFGEWLANAFYAIGLVTAAVVLFQRLWPRRQPPVDVDLEAVRARIDKVVAHCRDTCRAEYAAMLAKVEERIAAVEADVKVQTAALNEAGEARCRRIHERLEPLIRTTYRIAGKLDVPVQE